MPFPSEIESVQFFGALANNFSTNLAVGINATQNNIELVSTAGLPLGGFFLSIESEIIFCQGYTGNQLTVTQRGALGTVSAAHSSGVQVDQFIVSENVNQFIQRIIDLQTEIGKSLNPANGSIKQRLNSLESVSTAFRWKLSGACSSLPNNGPEDDFSYGRNDSIAGPVMTRSGQITAISVNQISPRSGGSVSYFPVINGVQYNNPGQRVFFDGSVGVEGEINNQIGVLVLPTPVNYFAGDVVKMRAITNSYGPNNSTTATVTFEMTE